MRVLLARLIGIGVLALVAAPVSAAAAPAWTCSASAGWLAAGAQRADAPRLGGNPCPIARSDAMGASGGAGSLTGSGSVVSDGGAASQTVDTRAPKSIVEAKSVAIQNPDGSLVVSATNLSARAAGACDANRRPVFTSEGTPGSVVLNGRTIDSSREYSEPGVGVNGAPLFGKITIRFNEVAASDGGLTRRAIHLLVTDRNGTLIFEAVAGEVSIGRDGLVCDPPPVCPPGQEPQSGRCVDVTVTPLPQPPAGVPPTGAPLAPRLPAAPRAPRACRDANAVARRVSTARLARATLCVMNAERAKRRLPRLRTNLALRRAAGRHVRDMVARRYFAHTAPSGSRVIDRILRSGYLRRYGRWSVGENLGWGWGAGASPRQIVAAWMRSRLHRRNILNRRFRDAGIAVKVGSPRERRSGSLTYVVDFGGFRTLR